MAGEQLGGGRGGKPPVLFFENRKKCPKFGKKGPDCVHLCVKFFIRNVGVIPRNVPCLSKFQIALLCGEIIIKFSCPKQKKNVTPLF